MTDQRYMREGVDFAVGKLVEECGELQAALGKTLRWGWLSSNPELPEPERETNVSWVRREMKDVVLAVINLRAELAKSGIVPEDQDFDDFMTALVREEEA